MDRRGTVISAFVVLLTVVAAIGAEKPPDAATLAAYANAARDAREQARQVRDWDAGLITDYFRIGVYCKLDAPGLKAASEAAAASLERIAGAYERADVVAMKEMRAQQDELQRVRALWRERVVEWRTRQFNAAPTEQWFQDLTRWYRGTGYEELQALAEARKAAADAWGRVAEACLPGADADAFDALKEEAYALDTERQIAEMRFMWARERENNLLASPTGKKLESPELTKRVEAMKKAQEERMAAKRAENEQDRRARQLDRQVKQAEREFQRAIEQAQKDEAERLYHRR